MTSPRALRRRALAGLLLATAALACEEVTAAERSDILIVRAEADGGVRLENRIDEPVYYFAADAEALALIDWIPCTDPSACPSVPARGVRDLPRTQIVGDQPGSHAVVVYHWRLVHVSGRFVPDSIRSTRVER